MLRITSDSRTTHVCRRDFLAIGAVGGLSFALPANLQAAPASTFGRARRCVLLFLTGGPPQHDTWDPKPDAPVEIRGAFSPIATSVPGVFISELFPRLARLAHRYCIVRSVTHSDAVHTSAGYTMLTGMTHPRANDRGGAAAIRPSPEDHPHLGAIVSRFGPASAVPTFISLPEVIKDAGVNEFPGQGAGFLGNRHGPMRLEANAAKDGFRLPDLVLPADLTATRLEQRGYLRRQLQQHLAAPAQADMEQHYDQAFALLHSPALAHAFDLDREPASVRAAYGRHLFGQGCLLARRLLEADVRFVTVYWHYEGPDDSPAWDTHWNNSLHLRTRLAPPTDLAVAALLDDLHQRGMLDDTLVICMGEFGRSPRINVRGGRDHWPALQSILLAGAGIPAGAVYGASDPLGARPADRPVTPADLGATLLHLLGIPHDVAALDRVGRPIHLSPGRVLADMLG